MTKLAIYIILGICLHGSCFICSAQDTVSETFNPYDEYPAEEPYVDEDHISEMKAWELQEKIDDFLEELNNLQNSYSRPFKITRDQRLSKNYM